MIKKAILIFIFIMSAGFMTNAFILTPTTYAACSSSFLGFPTWYRGLTVDNDCNIKIDKADEKGNNISKFIWTIVLNIIDIALRLVGIISVVFIMYGGFLFLARGSESDKIAEAKLMIRNAVIGLVLSIFSVAVVSYIVNIVFKGA